MPFKSSHTSFRFSVLVDLTITRQAIHLVEALKAKFAQFLGTPDQACALTIFFNLSIASLIASSELAQDSRTYPSPKPPKEVPDMHATPYSSNAVS